MKTTDDLNFLRVEHKSEDLHKEFARIAKVLFEQFEVIDKNGQCFLLVEIEYYLLSLWHQDFFTYGYEEQKNFGEWLRHPAGMDLVFGDQDNGIYAGILLRGIREAQPNGKFINGPLNVRDALSKMNHTVTTEDLNNSIALRRISNTKDKLTLAAGRVGLKANSLYEHHKRIIKKDSRFDNILPSKYESFISRNYRFITDICPENKFREKERVAITSVNGGFCTATKVNELYKWNVIKQ
ncbi:MAG: hypothetical protein V1733_11435 [bacterium]